MGKVSVPVEQLPPLNIAGTPHYRMRFRLISEDRNRMSHWSRLFLLEPTALPIVETGDSTKPITIATSNTVSTVSASWQETVFVPSAVTQPKTEVLKFNLSGHQLEQGQRAQIRVAGVSIGSVNAAVLGDPIIESISNYITIETPGFKLGAEAAADFSIVYRLLFRTLDLYYKWSNSNWIYAGRSTPNNSISLSRLSGATSISFALQRPTFPTERYDDGINTDSAVTAFTFQHTLV